MSAKWSRRERIAIQIATVFRIGEVAPWPGHYATLFTVPFAIALHKAGPWPHAIATLLLFAIGTWAAEEYSRLTGKHETAPWNKFSYGVADRGASIRVPHSFVNNGYKGYLEDRRPNSQGCPYQIASIVLKTIAEVPTADYAKSAA